MHICMKILFIFHLCSGILAVLDCQNAEEFEDFRFLRPIAKSTSDNLCFWAFHKGPCAEGEWFIFSHDALPIQNKVRPGTCQLRRCPPHIVDDWNNPTFMFWYQGNCLTTGSINILFCGNNTTKLYYGDYDQIPICSENQPAGRILSWIRKALKKMSWQDEETVRARKEYNQAKREKDSRY